MCGVALALHALLRQQQTVTAMTPAEALVLVEARIDEARRFGLRNPPAFVCFEFQEASRLADTLRATVDAGVYAPKVTE